MLAKAKTLSRYYHIKNGVRLPNSFINYVKKEEKKDSIFYCLVNCCCCCAKNVVHAFAMLVEKSVRVSTVLL